ncbi:MAG TPA: nitronate monooxygenase [Bdellovibrionota bacterium]|nr:nitronate monooxygenase [Bdellovibrionota bacterium]
MQGIAKEEPKIIQGGMGVGVSTWRLANAVARWGQLGVVSGTALDSVWTRKLQKGDLGGHFERAMKAFPVPEIAERMYRKYFSPSEKVALTPYKRPPMLTASPSKELKELLIVSNFIEVFLAKEGHTGLVGINYLEKLQMATLASVYGAMLAGVGYVLMGAGIPREIPGALDKLSKHEQVELKLQVSESGSQDDYRTTFSPMEIMGGVLPPLVRPRFLAIVSSSALALTLARKATGAVNGFVIEGATAGGHNAPPRGNLQFNERGEPIYGAKDRPDLEAIKAIGLPFWLAGSFGSPEGLRKALGLGAAGVQVGTAFALCEESGLSSELKCDLLNHAKNGGVDVFTDPEASPTGFPFKVARLSGTLSESATYRERPRKCDVGYLRRPYKREDGSLGYRCPAEPIDTYISKGGKVEETHGRKCLCNALLANIDLAQRQEDDYVEKPLITIGDDVNSVERFMSPGSSSYTAADVVRTLLG